MARLIRVFSKASQGKKSQELGSLFEDFVAEILKTQRYQIVQRERHTGMELDLVASHKDRREKIVVECKARKVHSKDIRIFHSKCVERREAGECHYGYFFCTEPFTGEARTVIQNLQKRDSWIYFFGPDKLVSLFLEAQGLTYEEERNIQLILEEDGIFALVQQTNGKWELRIFQNQGGKSEWQIRDHLARLCNLPASKICPVSFLDTLPSVPYSDFSARICPDAKKSHLSKEAIQVLRKLLVEKSGDSFVRNMSDMELLCHLGLVRKEGSRYGVTYAALILLGTEEALATLLPNCEISYEYRHKEGQIHHDERKDYRKGFLLCFDPIWEKINAHNGVIPLHMGLWKDEIPNIDEKVVREAILNAVCHREYTEPNQIFIRQSPDRIVVESPGNLPEGVTLENILDVFVHRNRKLAEIFQQLGFVERAGQGVDRMFHLSIQQGKGTPVFQVEGLPFVRLILPTKIQDPKFIQFLKRAVLGRDISLSLEDLLLLENLRQGIPVSEKDYDRLRYLEDMKLVERQGRGRGRKFVLHRAFYEFAEQKPEYARKTFSTADFETLILTFLRKFPEKGANHAEIHRYLIEMRLEISAKKLSNILQKLRKKGKIQPMGSRKQTHWKVK